MLWYVIQTYTGQEEKLVEMIRRMVPREFYGECFVVYHEQLRNRGRENQIHIERIFPGYAFVTSEEPEQLFLHLKQVPAMSKMMATGDFYFTPLEKEEAEFLSDIMDEDHIVRLSYVATDGRDRVTWLSGPLAVCRERIRGYRFRLRYASVALRLAGQEKEVRMGIILNDDIRREITYGKVEAPVAATGQYQVMLPVCGAEVSPGDPVMIIDGPFEGLAATVKQVRKNTVKVEVHLFGRDITAEAPATSVRKRAETEPSA